AQQGAVEVGVAAVEPQAAVAPVPVAAPGAHGEPLPEAHLGDLAEDLGAGLALDGAADAHHVAHHPRVGPEVDAAAHRHGVAADEAGDVLRAAHRHRVAHHLAFDGDAAADGHHVAGRLAGAHVHRRAHDDAGVAVAAVHAAPHRALDLAGHVLLHVVGVAVHLLFDAA